MNMNIFIYYGAELDKHDYENAVEKFGIMDFYSRIYSTGLNFKEVGELSHSWKYVVGKEIYWGRDCMVNINQFNDKFIVDGTDIKLKIDDESEIRKKLIEVGVKTIPTYKMFVCWS